MHTYQVGISDFEVHAPQYIHVGFICAHKKLQTKISEYEEYSNKISKRIEELDGITTRCL